jgi:hypothetical protein
LIQCDKIYLCIIAGELIESVSFTLVETEAAAAAVDDIDQRECAQIKPNEQVSKFKFAYT